MGVGSATFSSQTLNCILHFIYYNGAVSRVTVDACSMQRKETQLEKNSSEDTDFNSRIMSIERMCSFAIRHSSACSCSSICTNTRCCVWSSTAVTEENGNLNRRAYNKRRQLPVSESPGRILIKMSFLTRTTAAMRQFWSIFCANSFITAHTSPFLPFSFDIDALQPTNFDTLIATA